MKKSNKNTRAIACEVLLKVIDEGYSFQPNLITQELEPRDQAFVVHLGFGVLRHYYQLQHWLKNYLKSPLKVKDLDIQLLLLIGLYQLHFTDIPEYAILNETVSAVEQRKKPWARALLNGVLRKALQNKNNIKTDLTQSAPIWLIKAWKKAWPTQWESIVNANLTHPPLSLRINSQKTNAADYLTALNTASLSGTLIQHCPNGVIVSPEVNVFQLPGFTDGHVSVQDGASQLAAELLQAEPGDRVLDACAAPGGKTAHILEKESGLKELVAIEIDGERILKIKDNLKRLGLAAKIICSDAADINEWWDKTPFDRILLDPPCSATGIIRRHPDINLHRQPNDIAQLTKIQAELLNSLWPLLKAGGILVYSTCSILPEENTLQVARFLQENPDAQEWVIEANWGISQPHGRQILPGENNMDGFYYARIRKLG